MEQMKNVIDRVDNTVLAVIIDRNDHNAFNNAVRYFGVNGVNFIELDDHMLQARAWFEDDVLCRLFSTKKKANEFFYQYCCGCVNNRRFYEGIIVSMRDIKGVNNEN